MNSGLLNRSISVMFFLFLLIAGLYFAKDFFVPLALAGLLAMLFLPLVKKMESKGIHRAVAIIICVLLILSLVAGITWLISWQIGNFSEDAGRLKEQLIKLSDRIKDYAQKTLGINKATQQAIIKNQESGSGASAGKVGLAIVGSISDILINFILVIVYFFLLIYLRAHIKTFILKLVKQPHKHNAENIIYDASKVGQSYLGGLAMMIFFLWIMYSIGFSIAGVKYAIFFAILCGLLEIVPFVGNLTGTLLTCLMAVSQGAGSGVLIGVLITYGLVQFIQTYILEPLVVGAQVNINPLFTIIAIVLGEMIWGVPGMVLAIPLTGILKIICDHVEPLKPYGFLIGSEPKPKKKPTWLNKLKKIKADQ